MNKSIFLSILLCLIVLQNHSWAAPRRSDSWTQAGRLNAAIQIDVMRCNYRVAISYTDSTSHHAIYRIDATGHVVNITADPDYATLLFQMDYTDVAILSEAGVLNASFFQAYVDRLAGPAARPFAPLMHVQSYVNGQGPLPPEITFLYRHIDAQSGAILAPSIPLDGSKLVLEKQCF